MYLFQKAVKKELWVEISLEFTLCGPGYINCPFHSIHAKPPLCVMCNVTHWAQVNERVTGFKGLFCCWWGGSIW